MRKRFRNSSSWRKKGGINGCVAQHRHRRNEQGDSFVGRNIPKRQRTAALQDLAEGEAREETRQRLGVRLSFAAFRKREQSSYPWPFLISLKLSRCRNRCGPRLRCPVQRALRIGR